jgi:glycosyltransferase involved in cell wall biosynthesis
LSLSILVVSYRDIHHPEMGGAEVILHEVYRRLAARGHKVTFFTGAWPGGARRAEIDGMEVLRGGSTYTFNYVVPLAWRKLRGRGFDVMVEDLNKIPFFGPTYQKTVPVLANVPHLFGTTVFREAPLPIALYVYLFERFIPWSYGRSRFQVLSDSTKADLVGRGIAEGRIEVVRSGIDHDYYRPPVRQGTPGPVILYLGRLKKYKGIELTLLAMPRILERIPEAEYWIAGEGDYRATLEELAAKLGLAERVRFLGFQAGREKLATLEKTRVLVYTSPKEGWGLSVIEANAMGIPVVASDAPGLRESVRDGETGFLVPHGAQKPLAERLIQLLSDDTLWARMGQAGIDWAARFHWDRMADETEAVLTRAVQEAREGRGK